MLGTGFFVGLKATGPDMLRTADDYFNDYNLPDYTVLSTYGMDQSDIDIIAENKAVKSIEAVYSEDVFLKDKNFVTKVFSYNIKDKQETSKYRIEAGRLPKKSGEIALDSKEILKSNYKIGEKVSFVDGKKKPFSDTFKVNSYTIVGFVSTPIYIETKNRGDSTIGKGTTDAFALIPTQDFNKKTYSSVRLFFEDNASPYAFGSDYDALVKKEEKNLSKALKSHATERLASFKVEREQTIKDSEKKLADGRQELEQARQKLATAKTTLNTEKSKFATQKSEFNRKMREKQAEIDTATVKLSEARKKIDNSKATISKSETEIASYEADIKKNKAELDKSEKQLNEANKQIKDGEDQIDLLKQQSQLVDPANPPSDVEKAAAEQQIKEAQASLDAQKQEYNASQATFDAKKAELESGEQQLNMQKQKLADSKKSIQTGEADYKTNTTKLSSAKQELTKKKQDVTKQLAAGQEKLDDADKEYQSNRATFNKEEVDSEKTLTRAAEDIDRMKTKLDSLPEPSYYVLDRTNNIGYNEYKENANRLTSLATIFPAFFFFVAALVCLTTMTRMVEEQRIQMGTLKALGYPNRDIIIKFLIYGILASLAGVALGTVIGLHIFPRAIYSIYTIIFHVPTIQISFYLEYTLITLAVGILCTVIPVYFASYKEFSATTSELMRPKVPKSGKRLFLERVPAIWDRISYINKITLRNFFHRKVRMMMTIVGIAGSTSLLIIGIGLFDSIKGTVESQYSKMFHYDALITKSNDANKSDIKAYDDLLQDKNITNKLDILLEQVQTVHEGQKPQKTFIMVPNDIKNLSNFVALHDRVNQKSFAVPNNGAIISEKLATLFQAKKGDTIQLKEADGNIHKVKVANIAENYIGHYVYMSGDYYNKTFGKAPSYDTNLLLLKNTSDKWQTKFSETLNTNPIVLKSLFSTDIQSDLNKTFRSLTLVVGIIIVSAGLLTFVVLYNMININILEKTRDLATLKVLGFYNKELIQMLYREIFILIVFGILGGSLLGTILYRIVLKTSEIDTVMFNPALYFPTFLYSAITIFVFSVIVMNFMSLKFKKINMIEALKSVE
ncbi:FtsX-like permease family protein [Listeria weihenstephanensis]|uniref:FtsX-like permease family protein n=2 Tax=Listeria weihenstephanensis TaxID=1006155 RepID=A0A841Z465_9LIST|nr:FtsX-like permease family protein [Listeria weihenstephanensis]